MEKEEPPPGARSTRLEGLVIFRSVLILVDIIVYLLLLTY